MADELLVTYDIDDPADGRTRASNEAGTSWSVAPVGTWAPGTARAARLEVLWDEGFSTAEIGRRMGYSKNAIVGAVKRNHLPPRPSPLNIGNKTHSNAAGARQRAKQLAAAGHAPGEWQPLPASAHTIPSLASVVAATVPMERRPPVVVLPVVPPPVPKRLGGCQFALTDKRPWRFCEEVCSAPGSAWCERHRKIVYTHRSALRESTAG